MKIILNGKHSMEKSGKLFYEAPSMLVIEMAQKSVVCASQDGSTESFGLGGSYFDSDFD